MKPLLSVHNLAKSYARIQAVKGITFSVQPSEIFALIGPNGAGKSTTLRMIATLLRPTTGSIEVAGYTVHDHPEKVREVISYLPEEAGAYKSLSGNAYLRFMAALFRDDPREQEACVQRAQDISGLGNRLQDRIKTYSKGMTRKLLLARSIMTEPRLAILDEPTSGLDIINAMEVRTIIKSLSQQGMAVLLSSHNMLEVEFLSDRVGVIAQGVLHEVGTPQSLKEKYNARNLEEVFLHIAS